LRAHLEVIGLPAHLPPQLPHHLLERRHLPRRPRRRFLRRPGRRRRVLGRKRRALRGVARAAATTTGMDGDEVPGLVTVRLRVLHAADTDSGIIYIYNV
jgi:hypothetical protein